MSMASSSSAKTKLTASLLSPLHPPPPPPPTPSSATPRPYNVSQRSNPSAALHSLSPTPSHDDISTMSATATATLHMQDLDVGDADNTSNILMSSSPVVARSSHALFDPQSQPELPPLPSPVVRSKGLITSQPRLVEQQHQISQDACDDETTSAPKYCYRHRPDAIEDMSLEQVYRDSEREIKAMPASAQQGIQNIWSTFAAAPAKQRELMLRGILSQCCFPQLSFVSASVREMLKIDFLGALPPELGLRILCFLDAKSLCDAAQVSKTWKRLADDDVVWHRMCEQHIDRKCKICGWGLPLLDRQKLVSERDALRQRATQPRHPLPPAPSPLGVRSHISHTAIHQYPDSASDDGEPGSSSHLKGGSNKRTAAAVMPEKLITIKKSCSPSRNYEGTENLFPAPQQALPRPWKDVYRDRFMVGTNWKHGRYTQQILKGHTSEITCLQFDDEIIATGSYDATIRIWDVETGKELHVLTGHTMGVKCLQFDKSKLVSGSLDGTLKMWDLRNGRVIRTFPGHSGAVVSVHFDGSILASGSQDKTIRVRDFANCSRVSLKGHTDYVNSVRVNAASQLLFSASDDTTVRIWDLQGKRCLRILRGHSLQVTQVVPMPLGFDFPADLMDNDRSSSRSEPDTVMRDQGAASPPDAPHTAEHHSTPTYVLSSSMDSTVRLWEVSTGRCVRTFFGHVYGIWALAADALRMVSGANDGVVKLWDTRSARQERTFADHRAPVTCVGLNDKRMVTASEDMDVRVYYFGAHKPPTTTEP